MLCHILQILRISNFLNDMAKYRGKTKHREVHPKIFVWSHTEKAEIEYFQDFKQYLRTPLLMPRRYICWTPQELIEKVIKWKKKEINEKDGDQVWCIFDIDDFYADDSKSFLNAIKKAEDNNVKIAYANQCFELWILLHFQVPTSSLVRGKDIEGRVQKMFIKNALGSFTKNQKVFDLLLPFQDGAIRNAKKLLPNYTDIDWLTHFSDRGNPSTSIHCLIEEINALLGKR